MENHDHEAQIKELEKTIRILRKKLERSEKERHHIELDVASKESLLKNVIEKLQLSQQDLEQRRQDLQKALKNRQEMQMQLIQSEKMSALGQMVAGIAHEINNPLSFVYGNVDHAEEYIGNFIHLLGLYQHYYPEPHPEILAEIGKIDLEFIQDDVYSVFESMRVGTERIKNIITSLRTFSHLDESEIKTIDVHEGIESTLKLLQTRLRAQNWRSKIQTIKDYAELPEIHCYAGQLNQVFMSIFSNAIDAIEQRLAEENKGQTDAGAIAIRTALEEGEQVIISISDNGMGILPDDRDRIFDPFFTTKEIGKGTGLGLAIAHQIITEKHGGTLTCRSNSKQGTTFTITLSISNPAIDSS